MTTAVTLCNLALSQVPAGAITGLDETSVSGRACKLWYPQVLSELLEQGPWRFMLARSFLAAKANDREAEWAYAYTMPAYMAFPVKVLDEAGLGQQAYEFTGTTIYAQVPNAQVEFVTTQELTVAFSGLFRAALIAQLAARLCVPISKNFKRETVLLQLAEIALQRAQAANHNLNPAEYMTHVPDVLKARMGEYLGPNHYPGPEAVYPDFDPVGTFDSELD